MKGGAKVTIQPHKYVFSDATSSLGTRASTLLPLPRRISFVP